LLLDANYEEGKWLCDGKLLKIFPGERVSSLLQLKNDWGWSQGKVKKFLIL